MADHHRRMQVRLPRSPCRILHSSLVLVLAVQLLHLDLEVESLAETRSLPDDPALPAVQVLRNSVLLGGSNGVGWVIVWPKVVVSTVEMGRSVD